MIYRGSQRVKKAIRGGQRWKFLVRDGVQIWPCRMPVHPDTWARITQVGNEEFFEFGFESLELLSGSASTGWTDTRGRISLELQWSQDMATWATGKFVDCAGSPLAVSGGYEYWARSVYPRRSASRYADLLVAVNNSQMSPIVALRINDVDLALPHFPYSMPTAAGQLQTDLRAAGFSGAVVTASGSAWRISVPEVHYTTWEPDNRVWWPQFVLNYDIYGNPNYSSFETLWPTNYHAPGGSLLDPFDQFVRLAIHAVA